ncbi:hypothetical protein BZL30_7573 [Mycobacterium kansasii]|uniref:Uncharacterized protein n=1 Tax=Mycobacterium kansasii TaxID=1768 RepID=A0A1V3WLD0_MYCKA|nr:hypothetical protein BZL30_7573 [Mycobacterium kansasii]
MCPCRVVPAGPFTLGDRQPPCHVAKLLVDGGDQQRGLSDIRIGHEDYRVTSAVTWCASGLPSPAV